MTPIVSVGYPGGSVSYKTTASAGPATPTLVQMISSETNLGGIQGSASNHYKYYMPNALLAGNCLVIAASWPGGNPPTISDTVNGTWPAAITVVSGSNLDAGFIVLPSTGAGVTQIEATFGTNAIPFQWDIFEFHNVVGADGTHGTADAASSSLAVGSFTPTTNNNVNGGHLILSYFAPSIWTPTDQPTLIASGSGHTLLEADIAWTGDTYSFPKSSQYLIQTTNAAVNPSWTMTGGGSNTYNCIAIALKVGSAGSPIPAGIHINKIIHMTSPGANASSIKIHIPSTGNLGILIMDTVGGGGCTTAVDSSSNSWPNLATGTNADGDGVWYGQNGSLGANATLTMHASKNFAEFSFQFFDIQGAATSSYDTSVFLPAASGLGATWTGPSITPSESIGLTICYAGCGLGPGLSVTSPTGAIWDYIYYDSETDGDWYENADMRAHYYFSSNATQNWVMTMTNTGATVLGGAIIFK